MPSIMFTPQNLHNIERSLMALTRRTLQGGPGKPNRRAAVFVPLCNVRHEASVLFTLRSETVGTHKGQVSFPGGHVDADETAAVAAKRELVEELGPSLASAKIIGLHHDAIAVTGTYVTPVVGYLEQDMDDMSHLAPSAAEVATVFTIPIAHLLNPASITWRSSQFRSSSFMLPVFSGGPAPVWGLTAFMLHSVLKDVICPSMGLAPPAEAPRIDATASTSSASSSTTATAAHLSQQQQQHISQSQQLQM